jgi:hypothetical protein
VVTTCPRCAADLGAQRGWCVDCERQFDSWVRRHASDIVWQSLCGTVVICAVGLGLPILGVGWVTAGIGAFGAFGTIFGLSRLTRRVRRRQFLHAALPRAYLAEPK